MTIQFNNIVAALKVLAVVVTSIATLWGVPKGVVALGKELNRKQLEKIEKRKAAEEREQRQDEEIAHIKKELTLLMFGVSACLDGLLQQGCNHSVPTAKDKIDKYINEEAHK